MFEHYILRSLICFCCQLYIWKTHKQISLWHTSIRYLFRRNYTQVPKIIRYLLLSCVDTRRSSDGISHQTLILLQCPLWHVCRTSHIDYVSNSMQPCLSVNTHISLRIRILSRPVNRHGQHWVAHNGKLCLKLNSHDTLLKLWIQQWWIS